jgi:ribonuclease P protein component
MRLIFQIHDKDDYLPVKLRVAVSVGNRFFKKAVDRNRIKRLLRECWRLQKPALQSVLEGKKKSADLFIIYTGTSLPAWKELDKSMKSLLNKMLSRLT